MTSDAILQRVMQDEVALGLIVRLARSGEIARIARATGHDFIFIDSQHAIFSRETVAQMLEAANGCGIAALVRVRGFDDADATLFLDAGASEIIIPNSNTVQQAEAVVQAYRFPPRRNRSLPGPLIHNDFRPVPSSEAMRDADAILLIGMIETREGLANVDAIAAVDGLDVLHVGCVDLLLALDKPDEHGCPELLDAISRVAAAAKRHGKVLGVGGDRDIDRRARYIREGARFMTTGTDISLLMSAASTVVNTIRSFKDDNGGKAAWWSHLSASSTTTTS